MPRKTIQVIKQVNKRGLIDFAWRVILYLKANLRRVISRKIKFLNEPPTNYNFYFADPTVINKLVSNIEKSNAINEAKRILEHRITLFNHKELKFGSKIEWTIDPYTHKKWPNKRWNIINIRDAQIGDVRVVWELNRHRHFAILGKAYQYTHDREYHDEFANQLTDWLQENPYEMGVNWTSPLEAAMRAISWFWCYFLFKDAPQFREIERKILRSLKEHAEYIYRYRSEYLHPSNHIIGEASALYLISAAFPFLDRSLKWRNKAKKILEREIERQVYSDGCDKEQTFCYHRFVLDLLLQVFILSRQIDDNFSANFVQKIEKMIEFMMYVIKPDRKLPMIGDSDNARGMPMIDSEDFWLEKDIFCIGSILFNRGDFKYIAQEYTESAAWLLGESGYQQFCSIHAIKPKFLSKIFGQSGYYIMRTSWNNGIFLIFDAGPQGIGKVSGHGHADALSFTLSAFDKDIIMDAGTYTYFFLDKYRDHFRSTSAHNTVVVDDRPQSIPIASFDWDKIIKSEIMRWHSFNEYDVVDAYHRGYRPITHRRKLIFLKEKKYFIIKDYIYGNGVHKIDVFFHLAPHLRIIESDHNGVVARDEDLYLLVKHDQSMSLNIINDFLSYDYGQLVSSTTIDLTRRVKLPTEFTTILLLDKGRQPQFPEDAFMKIAKDVNHL